MTNSRDKGARYEREIANYFRDYGYEAHRTAQFRGNTGQAADVEGVPHIHIECKHQERLQPYDWIEQAVRDSNAAGKGDKPVVLMRKNGKETLAVMRLDDWFELYREWSNGWQTEE